MGLHENYTFSAVSGEAVFSISVQLSNTVLTISVLHIIPELFSISLLQSGKDSALRYSLSLSIASIESESTTNLNAILYRVKLGDKPIIHATLRPLQVCRYTEQSGGVFEQESLYIAIKRTNCGL